MQYVPRSGVWRSELIDFPLELNLAGSAEQPAPPNVEAARQVVSGFDVVLERAVAYAAEQGHAIAIANEKIDPQWLDVGVNSHGDHLEFELFFTGKDDYTLWSVVFQARPFLGEDLVQYAVPVGFSRRAW